MSDDRWDKVPGVLAELADVARAKGLLGVEVAHQMLGLVFKFTLGPAPAAPREAGSAPDEAAAKAVAIVNRKRERLRRDLGRSPTDDEIERLP